MAIEDAIYLAHPESASDRPLTEKQAELLGVVCRSNGGGVHINDWPKSTINGLVQRHLIQGKANHPYRFVHTAAGLKLWRKMQATTQGESE